MNEHTSVDPTEISKFDQHAAQWWNTEGALRTLHDINPARLEFIQKRGPLSKKTVLDIGCGGGILSESMAKAGANVTGLDMAQEAIMVAQRHAQENGLAIQYVQQAVEAYQPDQSGLFDIVTCMEMLEHVADPAVVIQHASRLIKPNGLIFLSTINRTVKAYMTAIIGAEYVLHLLPKQTHDYQKFIKPSELMKILRDAGFVDEALSGMDYNPFTRQASLCHSVAVNYLLVARKNG